MPTDDGGTDYYEHMHLRQKVDHQTKIMREIVDCLLYLSRSDTDHAREHAKKADEVLSKLED